MWMVMALFGWAMAASPAHPGADAVVLVVQGSSTCAGVFVDPAGTLVTAYHCVADGGRARVETRDGRRAIARVVAWRPRDDLAVLSAPDLAGSSWLSVRRGAPDLGERVTVWGHPHGGVAPMGYLEGLLRWSVVDGLVSAVGPRAIQISAPLNAGNSGGPVLDASGQIVGIVSRKLRGSGLGFATTSEAIRSALDDDLRGPALGGSFVAELALSHWEGPRGATAGGLRLEGSVRDRVVVAGTLMQAFRPTIRALRAGSTSWMQAEAVVGFRQRLGSGYWTLRTDGYGGIGLLTTHTRVADDLRTVAAVSPVPLFGLRATMGLAAADVALVPRTGEGWAARIALGVRIPGRLGVW